MRPVEIRCRYELTNEELVALQGATDALVNSLIRSRFGQQFSNQSALLTFLQSTDGTVAKGGAETEVKLALETASTSRS